MKVIQEDKMARAEINRTQQLENKKIKAREAQTKYFDQEYLATLKKSRAKVNKSADARKPVAFYLDWKKYDEQPKPTTITKVNVPLSMDMQLEEKVSKKQSVVMNEQKTMFVGGNKLTFNFAITVNVEPA